MVQQPISGIVLGGADSTAAQTLRQALASRDIVLGMKDEGDRPCTFVLNIVEAPSGDGTDQLAGEEFADRVSACVVPAFDGMRDAMTRLRPAGGCVVNLVVMGEENWMSAAIRGAVANLTRSVALHAGKAGYGIRVNSLCIAGSASDKALDAAADVIAWLGGSTAGFVTGVELAIGGEPAE